MQSNNVVTAQDALRLVQRHCCGPWLDVTQKDVEFKEILGGGCAALYSIEDKGGRVTELSKLVLRFLDGGKLFNPNNDPLKRLPEAHQAVLAFKMGELGHGPKQIGFFRGGRIEEYVAHRHLSPSDYADPILVDQIARKIAVYHGMNKIVPATMRPDPFTVIRHFLDNAPLWSAEWLRGVLEHHLPAEIRSRIDLDLIFRFDFETETQWLAAIREKVISPMVHTHNDLGFANLLVRHKPDIHGCNLMLIDYECSGMDRRGMDFASNFNYQMIGPTTAAPSDYVEPGYPSEEFRRDFFSKYLAEWQKEHVLNPQLDTIEHLLLESDVDSLIQFVQMFCTTVLIPSEYVLERPSLLSLFTLMAQTGLRRYFVEKERLSRILL